MKINVSIADDHPVVINGLEHILSEFPEINLYDRCVDGSDLLRCLSRRQPDVLLLDIQMPGKTGSELAEIISRTYPDISILALTNMEQTFYVRNMLLSGSMGFLLKTATPDMFIEAIETVFQRKQFIDPVMKDIMLQEAIEVKEVLSPNVTIREREILELIVNEYTSHEIAEKLFVSHRTVENHRLNLLLKLSVKNTAGLVRKAIQLGLID